MPFEMIPNMFRNIMQLAQLPDSSTFDMLWNDESIEEVTKKAATQAMDEDDFYDWAGPLGEGSLFGEPMIGLDDPNVVDKAKYQTENPNAILTPWGPTMPPETLDEVFGEYPGLESIIGLSDQEIDMMMWDADADSADYDEIINTADEIGMAENIDPNEVAIGMVTDMDQAAEQDSLDQLTEGFGQLLENLGLVSTAYAFDPEESTAGMEMAGELLEQQRFNELIPEDSTGQYDTPVYDPLVIQEQVSDLLDKHGYEDPFAIFREDEDEDEDDFPAFQSELSVIHPKFVSSLVSSLVGDSQERRGQETILQLNELLLDNVATQHIVGDIKAGVDAGAYAPRDVLAWLDLHQDWGHPTHERNDVYLGVRKILKREVDELEAASTRTDEEKIFAKDKQLYSQAGKEWIDAEKRGDLKEAEKKREVMEGLDQKHEGKLSGKYEEDLPVLMRTAMLDQFKRILQQKTHPASLGAYTYYQILSPQERSGMYGEVETLFWLHKGEDLFRGDINPTVEEGKTAFNAFVWEYMNEPKKYAEYTRGSSLKEKARKMATYIRGRADPEFESGDVSLGYATLADMLFGEGDSIQGSYAHSSEAFRRRNILLKVYHSGHGYGSSPENIAISNRMENDAQWGVNPIYSFYSNILGDNGTVDDGAGFVQGQDSRFLFGKSMVSPYMDPKYFGTGPRFGGVPERTLREARPSYFGRSMGEDVVPGIPTVPSGYDWDDDPFLMQDPIGNVPPLSDISATPMDSDWEYWTDPANYDRMFRDDDPSVIETKRVIIGGKEYDVPVTAASTYISQQGAGDPYRGIAAALQRTVQQQPGQPKGVYSVVPATGVTVEPIHIDPDLLSTMPDPFDDEQGELRSQGLPYLTGRWTEGGSFEWEGKSEAEKQAEKSAGHWKSGVTFVPTNAYASLLNTQAEADIEGRGRRQVRGFGDL